MGWPNRRENLRSLIRASLARCLEDHVLGPVGRRVHREDDFVVLGDRRQGLRQSSG